MVKCVEEALSRRLREIRFRWRNDADDKRDTAAAEAERLFEEETTGDYCRLGESALRADAHLSEGVAQVRKGDVLRIARGSSLTHLERRESRARWLHLVRSLESAEALMARKVLRALIRREINEDTEVNEGIQNLNRESDRGVALAGACYLEKSLRLFLISAMDSSLSGAQIREIFDGEGFLSHFSSKIRLARAFGLITPTIASDLDCVRDIRNTFAHAGFPITFRIRKYQPPAINYRFEEGSEMWGRQLPRPEQCSRRPLCT
jgi:hypothetical protein